MDRSMKSAKTASVALRIGTNPDLRATWCRADQAGSCNACSDRSAVEVCEVHLRGLSFRLCPACKDQLQGLFSAMKATRKESLRCRAHDA